jgi:hypothetical protein
MVCAGIGVALLTSIKQGLLLAIHFNRKHGGRYPLPDPRYPKINHKIKNSGSGKRGAESVYMMASLNE